MENETVNKDEFCVQKHCFIVTISKMEEESTDPDLDKGGKGKEFGGGEDFESDLQVSASAFEALERDFQEVAKILRLNNSPSDHIFRFYLI